MTSSYAIPAQLDYIVYSNKANSLFYSLIVSLHPLPVLQIESYVLLSLTKKFKTNFKFVMPSEELFTIKIHIYIQNYWALGACPGSRKLTVWILMVINFNLLNLYVWYCAKCKFCKYDHKAAYFIKDLSCFYTPRALGYLNCWYNIMKIIQQIKLL